MPRYVIFQKDKIIFVKIFSFFFKILGHVDSLKMETETSAPGEKPRFLGVREQRVTGVAVFILTGLSVKLAPILLVRFY